MQVIIPDSEISRTCKLQNSHPKQMEEVSSIGMPISRYLGIWIKKHFYLQIDSPGHHRILELHAVYKVSMMFGACLRLGRQVATFHRSGEITSASFSVLFLLSVFPSVLSLLFFLCAFSFIDKGQGCSCRRT